MGAPWTIRLPKARHHLPPISPSSPADRKPSPRASHGTRPCLRQSSPSRPRPAALTAQEGLLWGVMPPAVGVAPHRTADRGLGGSPSEQGVGLVPCHNPPSPHATRRLCSTSRPMSPGTNTSGRAPTNCQTNDSQAPESHRQHVQIPATPAACTWYAVFTVLETAAFFRSCEMDERH